MAKIGKIRFVNFTYNENRHIYDQTFDFYNGEDTLLNLQNGGGKTVLVQMMMQPIVPKQKLKDRSFKGYFKNIKAPVYIMIEWILDDSSKRVMTGIGIKRIMGKSIEDKGESLKIVTFISEYEGESSFDIKNIELLEEEKGIVKLIEFDRVIRNISTAEKEGNAVWLFRWDLADNKKEYARRLQAYKINQLEWKNLMVKINEAEAGLNSFFNDCKTTNSLIKKWFIPTIEEQLNRNGDFVENIKELIKNHTEQIVKNEDMIREREIFEDFKRKSKVLYESLMEYKDTLSFYENNKRDLANSFLFVNDRIESFDREKEEMLRNITILENAIKELEYEKLSGEYHQAYDALEKIKQNSLDIENKMNELKAEIFKYESRKNLLSCKKLKDEVKNLNSKIAKYETELEKESLQQEDIRNIINDLEYSLKEKYRAKVLELQKTIDNEKRQLSNENSRLSKSFYDYGKIKEDISKLNDQLIAARGRLAVFEESERTLRMAYPDFLPVRDIDVHDLGEESINTIKVMLDEEEAELEKNITELNTRHVENQNEIDKLERQIKEMRDKYPLLVIEKNKHESDYNKFENKKNAIVKIIKSYQLSEDFLYNKEKLLIPLYTDKEKFTKLIGDKSLENSIFRKQLKIYESGKAFEVSEDLKQILEDNSILVEFGYEWLKSLQENKTAKLKLVKSNPFLPYSLIVSRKDIECIREMEFKGVISPIIPIVERERLESAIEIRSRNSLHSYGDIDFLIAFDDRILNKNYLKEVCDDLINKISKNNDVIKTAQEALKNVESDIFKVEEFNYTEADKNKMSQDISRILKELEESTFNTRAMEAEIVIKKNKNKDEMAAKTELLQRENRFLRKREEIYTFFTRYEGYSVDLKEKNQKEEALNIKKTEMEVLDKEIADAKESMHGHNFRINNISKALEKAKENYQKYSDVKHGKYINEEIEQLESKLASYTSKIGIKIQAMRDILEDYKRDRNEKQKKIDSYGIEESQYMGMEYSQYEFESLEEQLDKINGKFGALNENKNSIQFTIAEKNSDLRYMKKSIMEKCGYDEPKVRESIRKLDYDTEKNNIKTKQKNFEKQLSRMKAQENNLQRVRFALEEYSLYVPLVTEVQAVEGDINEHVLTLVKEHKELAELSNTKRNSLTDIYSEIESEFIGRAEMFKSLFNSILDSDKKYQPTHAMNALDRVYLQIDRKLEQHSVDIKKIDNMESCIIDNTISYLMNVYDEMNSIDRNSTIDVDGKRCKMLIIDLPQKDNLESISLKEYLKNTIRNCVSMYKQGKALDNILMNEISTFDLFDRLVSISKIGITLVKIEPNKLKKKSWKEVIQENSGGELFVSAFVVFISLLTYMRGENLLGSNMESKVLIMDNPFGPITSEHLLKPLFEISKKYNTQMICLSDMKEHTIYDRFNLIYSVNIEREIGREEEYIELKTIKRDIEAEEDEFLSVSMFKIEDKSRFELVN
jgi:chromosome segregation ATPase